MKLVTKNSIAAFALVVMLGITPNVMPETIIKNPCIALRLAGQETNQPVLQLDIENNDKDVFFITIRDQDGVVLHKENAKNENITRRFRLDTEDLKDAVLQVTITSKRTAKPTIFEVKLNTKVTQETKITSVSE
jgi:outer membrane lipoprotein-sorting protein